ncbi:MAG: hypothetical protein EPN84_04855 [Legionella sp.]|nr:MAG: hypothetical protein EPN84_04855 [Legionella sp.]
MLRTEELQSNFKRRMRLTGALAAMPITMLISLWDKIDSDSSYRNPLRNDKATQFAIKTLIVAASPVFLVTTALLYIPGIFVALAQILSYPVQYFIAKYQDSKGVEPTNENKPNENLSGAQYNESSFNDEPRNSAFRAERSFDEPFHYASPFEHRSNDDDNNENGDFLDDVEEWIEENVRLRG